MVVLGKDVAILDGHNAVANQIDHLQAIYNASNLQQ